jgi:hypothetical protein
MSSRVETKDFDQQLRLARRLKLGRFLPLVEKGLAVKMKTYAMKEASSNGVRRVHAEALEIQH